MSEWFQLEPPPREKADAVQWQQWVERLWRYVRQDAKAASFTATDTMGEFDKLAFVSCAAGAATLSIPTAVGKLGQVRTVIKTDTTTNLATLDPYSTQTIFGQSSIKLSGQNDGVSFVSDDANWLPVSPMGNYRLANFVITASGTPTASTDAFKVVSSVSEAHQGHPSITLVTGIFSAAPQVTATTQRAIDNDRYSVGTWLGSAPTATAIDIWSNFTDDQGGSTDALNGRDQSMVIHVSVWGPR